MQDLTIALIQTDLVWENTHANLEKFDHLLAGLPSGIDLVLLPEMFNTGFSIQPGKLAEKPDGETFKWLTKKAADLQCVIAGSVLTEDHGKFYNRLYWVYPDGRTLTYDKRHLFRMGDEVKFLTPGKSRKIFHIKGWRVLPLICYDLRFPVWIMNHYAGGVYEYDLIVVVANWPAIRRYSWRQLIVARAIENLACVAAVNRIGVDGNNMAHSGDSMVVDAQGRIIADAGENCEKVILTTLSVNELHNFRHNFPVGIDWDDFTLHSEG